jgi:hypothetical protein
MDHEFQRLTTPGERRDEQFMERVSICFEDGLYTLPAAIEVAREERQARLQKTLGPFANVQPPGRKQP